MTSKYYPLGDKERQVYDLVARALQGLSEPEQHNVLKEVGLRLGREFVPLGAVRAASIAGSIRAGASEVAKGPPRKSFGKAEGTDPAFKAWSENEGKALVTAQKSVVFDDPPTEKQKEARRAASGNVRAAWQSFRSGPG